MIHNQIHDMNKSNNNNSNSNNNNNDNKCFNGYKYTFHRKTPVSKAFLKQRCRPEAGTLLKRDSNADVFL